MDFRSYPVALCSVQSKDLTLGKGEIPVRTLQFLRFNYVLFPASMHRGRNLYLQPDPFSLDGTLECLAPDDRQKKQNPDEIEQVR